MDYLQKGIKFIRLAWTIWIMCFFLFFFFSISDIIKSTALKIGTDSSPSSPGLLPDNKLYKLKVLRNKIIERIIIDPIKKVEFDLLMADKTIYASKLLVDKGEIALAKDTALKGENYYSILVQDYNKTLLQRKKIPESLDSKISLAAIKHQEIFKELENKVNGKDKETFQVVNKFSKINYDFILALRKSKNY